MNSFLRAFLVAAALMMSSQAMAGTQDLGGGNVYEAEFKQIGRGLVAKIREARLGGAELGYEVIALETAVQEIQPLAVDEAGQINGVPRQAINSLSERTIRFANATWMILSAQQKELLVLHEYLRFVVKDGDAEYAYSLRTMELLKNGGQGTAGRGRVSARAKKYQITGFKVMSFAGMNKPAVSVVENGYEFPFDFFCKKSADGSPSDVSVGSLVVWTKSFVYDRYDDSLSFPQNRKVTVQFRSVEACEAMKNLIFESSEASPVTMIYDPVRALTNPNEVLTFEF